MTLFLSLLALITIVMTYIALKQEKQYKLNAMIEDGYKPNAKDRDKDGILQEGTKWERKATPKKPKKK